MQSLARHQDVAQLTAGYGLVVADECHHVPAAAFEHAVKQIGAKYWLGLTATLYRRDKLDDLIGHQVGPVRHEVKASTGRRDADDAAELLDVVVPTGGHAQRPDLVLRVHQTGFRYSGTLEPPPPGGMAAVYREMAADQARNQQVVGDVVEALGRGRHCLVLIQRTGHLDALARALAERGHDPVTLRGGMGAKERSAALARLQPPAGDTALLVIATGS